MPLIDPGNVQSQSINYIEGKDYNYKYPDNLDLRPDSDLHNNLRAKILERALAARTEISERFDSWREIDKTLVGYIPTSEAEKRVKEKAIPFVVRGIQEIIKNPKKQVIMTEEKKPIVELAEKCQKHFGESMTTEVISQTGPCHAPVIEVEIALPNGQVYTATGRNQRLAKQEAAKQALSEW